MPGADALSTGHKSVDVGLRVLVEAGSLSQVVRNAATVLAFAGIEHADNEVTILLAHAAGIDVRTMRMRLMTDGEIELDSHVLAEFNALLSRRTRHEPLQYITGHAPFRWLDLEVGPGVFIPRPETELVVEYGLEVIRHISEAGSAPVDVTVVDLCAGSGAIGLSFLAEINHTVPAQDEIARPAPSNQASAGNVEVWAVEYSPSAAQWASRNRDAILGTYPELLNRYHLVEADAGDPRTLCELDGGVDLVLSNPPYVPQNRIPEQPEVREHDPALALYGGSADGLRIPERIVRTAARLLKSSGVLVMEHDITQADALVAFARTHGFRTAETAPDMSGRPRYLIASRSL